MEVHRTKQRTIGRPCDPRSIERGVRQCLADKVSGSLVGLWLLLPEHLRLGTWDLLCGWTGQATGTVAPRLAMQLVHEAALCITGLREHRSLTQQEFNLANGLPFVATDQAIHDLLEAHSIEHSQRLQIALGQIRYSLGHFKATVLAIDPHRLCSYTKRQMPRQRKDLNKPPAKMLQAFFCLDAQSRQPLGFTLGSSARTVSQATPELLDLCAHIIPSSSPPALAMADCEHYTASLFEYAHRKGRFDLLVPMPSQPCTRRDLLDIPADHFHRRWSGYATFSRPYTMPRAPHLPLFQFIQRCGEPPKSCQYKAFLCTDQRDEVPALSVDYPARWHIETFFDQYQAHGWDKARTHNLHIRYGRMTMALFAQTACFMMRQKLAEPFQRWDASHFSENFLRALDADLRVHHDTLLVTFYNAPHSHLLRRHYENLPQKLQHEGISPNIPWLYDFKLDFRFK